MLLIGDVKKMFPNSTFFLLSVLSNLLLIMKFITLIVFNRKTSLSFYNLFISLTMECKISDCILP